MSLQRPTLHPEANRPISETGPDKSHVPGMKRRFLSPLGRLWESAGEFMSHDPLTLAASVAFYTALSFAPMIVLSLWVAGALSPEAEASLVKQLGSILGPQVEDTAVTVIEHASASSIRMDLSGAVNLGALIVSATTAFAQLQAAINRVWGLDSAPANALWQWVRRRLLSFGMLAIIGFLLMITFVVTSALALILAREDDVWTWMNEAITLVLFSSGFALMFRFVPDVRIPFRFALIGGAFTAVFFEGGKWVLGVYLAKTTTADAYGGASSLVLLLLWVYYASLIVLAGAALTRHVVEMWGPSGGMRSESLRIQR